MMHKKIGIIGGLSPESTSSYYLHLTRTYAKRFGDYGYPEIIIYSVTLQNYHRWRSEGRWDLIAQDLSSAAHKLQQSGAELGIIATNTMHKVFDEVQASVDLPLVHILDGTVAKIRERKLSRLGLLGTKFTMSECFYKDRLMADGIEPIVPGAADQQLIHDIIVHELDRGEIRDGSRDKVLGIIAKLRSSGAEGIILGCTEIPLLIKQADCALPVFDTAAIHAERALDLATG